MLLTGDKINGAEAERIGLVCKAVPADQLDAETERLAARMATVPVNQLMMQKLMINQAIEAMGLKQTQMFATVFDGITRHSPEGINFKHRAEQVGWKKAVSENATRVPMTGQRTARSIPVASGAAASSSP
jgi:enoyl-CoA hydratase